MLVGMVHGERWPFHLQVEVDKARRSLFHHILVERVHRCIKVLRLVEVARRTHVALVEEWIQVR